jgi:hypothetical protein
VRPFDKAGYVLEDTDPEVAPETDENEAQGDRMASPATPGEGGVVVGSRVRPVNEDLCKKVHELRQQNRGIGIKAMARTLGVESKAVRDACEDLGMQASPRASPSLATPSGGDSTPRRSSGELRASSAPLRPSAHYAPSLLHPLLRRAFRTLCVRLHTAAQLAAPPARASAQWLYHPFTRPRARTPWPAGCSPYASTVIAGARSAPLTIHPLTPPLTRCWSTPSRRPCRISEASRGASARSSMPASPS